ncbi:MAG: ATP synthase subunit C [Steroidobacteraceae bacterium]|jgi:V/A-type H+-transporting ATPase subunit K
MKLKIRGAAILVGTLAVIVGAAATVLLLIPTTTAAQTAVTAAAVRADPQLMGWAFMSAALSTGLAALAAGFAVARVGSGAVGAVAEKPELFGRVLVLVGLAEGIAIYGLIVSILILNRVA